MTNSSQTDVAAICERLRAEHVDVVRVSFPDLIGVDRGRDVLVDELPAAVEHGLAFCRAVYHTSPMGDVVPVRGGLDAGLPDVLVRPDLRTLTPLPWEPNAAWCLGDASRPDGQRAPESPRAVARRVAERLATTGHTLICGPELEFFLCEQDPAGRWRRYANELGNVYVVGRKGRHAIGGVLTHARALSALLNPTINSYKRFGPDTLAPWLIDWGLDNRSAMVRIPPERGQASRMEVRLGDATANPYLAMAAIGAAVCLGIKDKIEPGDKLEGYGYDPAKADMLPMRRLPPVNGPRTAAMLPGLSWSLASRVVIGRTPAASYDQETAA